MKMYQYYLKSPFGELILCSNGEALTGLYSSHHEINLEAKHDKYPFQIVIQQLEEYFAGERKDFSIPLHFAGTEFQKKVWAALQTIPFGVAISYQALAQQIDHPKAYRAVGLANSKNPISIIVPCHRVIGANGTLTGYAGGLDMKEWLLRHEGYSI